MTTLSRQKIRFKLSLRAAPARGAARRCQKTALCQIPKAFAFLQKEKPKSTKKKESNFAAPHNKMNLHFKFFPAMRAKIFVAVSSFVWLKVNHSTCSQNLARCLQKTALCQIPKVFATRVQSICCRLLLRTACPVHQCLRIGAQLDKKSKGAASLRPKPHVAKSINFKFVGAKLAKNSLQALATRGPSVGCGLPPSKNDTFPNLKGFRILAKGKTQTNKKRGAASLRPKPHAAKSINFKFFSAARAKKIVASSHCVRPAALKTAFCQISKAFALLQKEKTKIERKGAQLRCAPNPMWQNQYTSNFLAQRE